MIEIPEDIMERAHDLWRHPYVNEREGIEAIARAIMAERDRAADRIEQLEAENARLREALKPFADAANNFDKMPVKNPDEWFAYSGQSDHAGRYGAISVANLLAARAALAGKAGT